MVRAGDLKFRNVSWICPRRGLDLPKLLLPESGPPCLCSTRRSFLSNALRSNTNHDIPSKPSISSDLLDMAQFVRCFAENK